MKKLLLILMVSSLFPQEGKQSINKYKYHITASTTLESLALDKRLERQKKGGGVLTVSGLLFFIDIGPSTIVGEGNRIVSCN